MTHAELIERLGKLTGPDRAADLELTRLWDPKNFALYLETKPLIDGENREFGEGQHVWTVSTWTDGGSCNGGYPKFTASIDAAVALVERIDAKHCYRIEKVPPSGLSGPYWATAGLPGEQEQAIGPTPAIALCLALLRARTSKEGDHG